MTKMQALVVEGHVIRPIRVTFNGSTYVAKDGSKYAAQTGQPLIYQKSRLRRYPVILLSQIRAAAFNPPAGYTTVPLGSTNADDSVDYKDVQVTPELFGAINIEAAAKALAAAQKPPFWLMAIMVLGGVGVGWVLKMIADIVTAKVSQHAPEATAMIMPLFGLG